MPAASPNLAWNFDPFILGALASYLAIYVIRWRQARAEAGPRGASGWRLTSFALGLCMLFVGLVSPLDSLGEQLFVAHMAQHLFLGDFAAIFLLLGLTRVILRPVTARMESVERRLGLLAAPVAAVAVYVATLWIWHIPGMYQLGLRNSALHPIQHLSFFAAALVFWWFVLSPIPSRRRLKGMAVTFYMAGARLLTGILAAVITWAPVFLYEYYARQPRVWGLSVETDQALAGALMMVNESIILTVATVILFIRMLGQSEREEQRIERFETG